MSPSFPLPLPVFSTNCLLFHGSVLPEAFAVVREGAERTVGLRPFDVQLIGGYFLHKGYIAEMKTGEGKTLTATLPLYLNALEGKGAHLVTVNDYLAKRDAEWMGKVFSYLGLSVGVIAPDMDEGENGGDRREQRRLSKKQRRQRHRKH